MRHVVNFGLLFCFGTIAATGGLAFWKPFSLVTTRVHIVFGVATLVLVAMHLAARRKYFFSQLRDLRRTDRGPQQVSAPALAGVLLAWAGLWGLAWGDWGPVPWLIQQGYEARNRREIVRTAAAAGWLEGNGHRMVARVPTPDPVDARPRANLSLRVELNRAQPTTPAKIPAMAIWTESTVGSMIETIYLDPRLAYAERPEWHGRTTPRHEILPIWRHRYSLVSGIEPAGTVDAFSGATARHSFSLDDYLVLDEAGEFVLCVEINQAADPNGAYPDPHLGQPSLLYTALIAVSDAPAYHLLQLTGHGGDATQGGVVRYDLERHSTATRLVELLLARVAPGN